MTTRAEEIAAEGPYRVVDAVYMEGPTGRHGRYWNERDAESHAKQFNAAYKQGQQDRWIPVSERLPEEGKYEMSEMVLCQTHKEGIAVLSYSYRYKQWRAWNGDEWPEATHWQPLPSPPNPEQS